MPAYLRLSSAKIKNVKDRNKDISTVSPNKEIERKSTVIKETAANKRPFTSNASP